MLLSSHLLNEVELIADEMILIGRGRIVAQGTRSRCWPVAPAERPTSPRWTTSSLADGARPAAASPSPPPATGLRVEADPVEVGRAAAEQAIVLTDLRPAEGGLEDLFLELTADTQRESVTAEGVAA